jgi:hypothetical protein
VLEPTLDDRPTADFVGPDLGRDACEVAVADRKRPLGVVVDQLAAILWDGLRWLCGIVTGEQKAPVAQQLAGFIS